VRSFANTNDAYDNLPKEVKEEYDRLAKIERDAASEVPKEESVVRAKLIFKIHSAIKKLYVHDNSSCLILMKDPEGAVISGRYSHKQLTPSCDTKHQQHTEALEGRRC